MTIQCPNCRSTDVTYRSKKNCYICEDCDAEFINEHEFKVLRIFISYGHDEHAVFAKTLARDLKEKGHEVWFDLNRLKPGGDWERYIEEGLIWTAEKPGSGRIILVMTPHSVRRPDGYCLNEIARALDHHLLIIPVMLVWCSPPLSISRIQWLDMQHCKSGMVSDGKYIATRNRLLEALETQRIDFEGQPSFLRNNLNPLSFEADVIHYQKWFTGREWVFDKLDAWLAEPSASRLFWITGLPGIGKTAIATRLIQRLENLVAFHLCRRGNSEKASPRRAVMSISYQLSTQLPDYAEKLAGISLTQLLSDPNVNSTALFDGLIVQPLASDIQRPLSPRIILIDGLDEATHDGRNQLAEFIATEFNKLPDWLRIIITSRPDPEVTIPMQGWDRWTLETEDPQNQNDLKLYIDSMLADFSPQSISDDLAASIIHHSEGIFLYAEWVCREIKEGRLSPLSTERFPKGLGGIYDEYFKKKLTREEHYQEDIISYQVKVRPVLELIIAAREPLPFMQISRWLGWNRYEQESFFKKLGSLFFLDSTGCIRPFHASVLDWLVDPEKSGEFFVNVHDGDLKLTDLLWDEYHENGALELSGYALRFLPAHLIKLEKWKDAGSLLCDLNFNQAKAAIRMTYELVNDFNALLMVVPHNRENIIKENERQVRLCNYTQNLVSYSSGASSTLDIPESITPWSDEMIEAEINRIKENPGPLDKIKGFYQFLGHEAGTLQSYAHELPGLATQQAWNNFNSGPVGDEASRAHGHILDKLLLRPLSSRPIWNPLPAAQKVLTGHSWYVLSIAISSDGNRALSASFDKTCIVWDLQSGKPRKTLQGHTDPVNSVSMTPDGMVAISGSRDKKCILWDLEKGTPLKTLSGHFSEVNSVAITPDGKLGISASEDKTLILWDLTSGKRLKTLSGHHNNVTSVAITPDGKQAVSASWDHTCFLWDLQNGKPVHQLIGHTDRVKCIAITPDGLTAISASDDTTCIVWNLNSGKPLQKLSGHKSCVQSISITPDGKQAVSASWDKTVIHWDLQRAKPFKILTGHTARVNSVAISADGMQAVTASWDHTCIHWDLQCGKTTKTHDRHTKKVGAISISSETHQVVSGSPDASCFVWDTEDGKLLKKLDGHTGQVNAVTLTPDGKLAISASSDRTCIVWDLLTGKPLKILEGHHDPVNSVSITPDGRLAVSASWDTCILWDVPGGKPIRLLNGHKGKVNMVTIMADGSEALSASNDKNCILWDLESGKPLKVLEGHSEPVNSVQITTDGKLAVSVSWDKTGIVWNLQDGKLIVSLSGHKHFVHSIALTLDGNKAITASWDTCIVWELPTGKRLNTFAGHTDHIKAIAITSDGKLAISVAEDKTAILWDIQNGRLIGRYIGNHVATCLSTSNSLIALGTASGEVIILKIPEYQ